MRNSRNCRSTRDRGEFLFWVLSSSQAIIQLDVDLIHNCVHFHYHNISNFSAKLCFAPKWCSFQLMLSEMFSQILKLSALFKNKGHYWKLIYNTSWGFFLFSLAFLATVLVNFTHFLQKCKHQSQVQASF